MRSLCLFLLAAATPAAVLAEDAPYYGPMVAWHGIGTKFGYKESAQADGSWRVTVNTRSGEALDIAMYRAAELARDSGFSHVELLGGTGSRSPGYNSATLYARPSKSVAAPATCPTKRAFTCYTASVAQLLRQFGNNGRPGVAVADYRDEFGREVYTSSYGKGIARKFVPLPVAQVVRSSAPVDRPDAATAYARTLEAAQPVRGREPRQGWTVSD